jgi:hypothetical protein
LGNVEKVLRRKKDAGMTPAQEKREEEKLRTAIYRWYRLGGRLDTINEIAGWMYATKTASWVASQPIKDDPDE